MCNDRGRLRGERKEYALLLGRKEKKKERSVGTVVVFILLILCVMQ